MSTSVTVSGNEPTSITITQSNAAAATANNLSSVLSNTSSDISSLKGATGTLDTNINTVSGLITSNDSEISALNTATGDLSTATGVLQSATGSFAQTDQPASFSTLDVSGQSQFDKKVKITPNNGIALHAHSSGTNNAAVRIECEGPVLVGHDLFQKGGFTDGFADNSNHFHALIDINRIEQQPEGDVKNIERVEEKYYAIQNNNLPNSKAAFWEWHKVARKLAVSTVDTSTATLDVSLLQNSSNRSADSQAFFSLNTTPDGKSEEITITLNGHSISNGASVRMTFDQSFEGPIVAASLFGKVTSVSTNTLNVELYGGNYKTTGEVPLGTDQTALTFDNVILELIGTNTIVQSGNETNLQLYSKTNFTPNRLKDETLKATWSVAHGLVKNEHCTLITDGRGDFDILQSAYVLDPDPDGDNLSVILVYGRKVQQFDFSSFTAFGSDNWTLHKGSIDGIHHETVGDNLFSFNANNVGEYNSYQIGPGSQVDADCISIGKNVYNKDASTIKIGYDNEMLNITSTGVEVSGGLTIAEKIIHKDDPNTFLRFGANDDTFSITTEGSERLHIGPAGNVGLGTNPSANGSKNTLHIHEDTHGAAIRLSQGSSSLIRYDDTTGLQVGTLADKKLSFETNDITAMTIDTGQNVGIGTTSPQAKLHVSGDAIVSGSLVVTDQIEIGTGTAIGPLHVFNPGNSNTTLAKFENSDTTSNDHDANVEIISKGQGESTIQFKNPDITHTNGFQIGFGHAQSENLFFRNAHDARIDMVINQAGNVGAGTITPSAKLHIVSGAGTTPGLGSEVAVFQNNDNTSDNLGIGLIAGTEGNAFIHFGDADSNNRGAVTFKNSNNSLVFKTLGSERVTITNDGDVGIGTDSPGAKLEVDGNIKANGTITSTSTTSRPIQNDETDSTPIRNIKNITQSAYDTLTGAGNEDANTLYIIVG